MWLFLTLPWVGLHCVIVVFSSIANLLYCLLLIIVSEYEPYYEQMLSQIYLTALHLNSVNSFDTKASFCL